ncbi:hypothetical protein CCHR01_01290 [Colletotrichum chrysophilum]|uniref:Uncharacterized protein n=1 Tax=Colletotrichum chrysophilum TaxID=1836956 RepID=A0AAD9AWV8_9PEZI|nr:hypothetical protein CCHR01_01290 [Colletotrichum chrysophilum]
MYVTAVPETCPTNEIPDALPIPKDMTYVVIPGQNVSDPWMVNCCHPNPVNLVNKCWEWCQVPDAIKQDRSESEILSVFSSCLRAEGKNASLSNGVQVRSASSPPNRPIPFAGLFLATLAACTLGLVV